MYFNCRYLFLNSDALYIFVFKYEYIYISILNADIFVQMQTSLFFYFGWILTYQMQMFST